MLVLVLVLLSLVAVPFEPARALVLAGDVLFVCLVAFDFARTPSPARLGVDRDLPSRVGLGADLRRVLRVEPGRAAGLTLEVREEFPAAFEVRERTVDGVACPPASGPTGPREPPDPPDPTDPTGGPDRVRLPDDGSECEIARVYGTRERGVFELGSVRLRLRSPLGLLQRQSLLVGRQRVAVEPALAGLRRTLQLAASERWRDLGVRSLRRRGGMTDFESLRDYVPGDDVRRIDWKAFARRGAPTVRQYQVERGQELILLVDTGRRMASTTGTGRSRGWTKLDHALDAALQLAAVALQEGDRVGVLAFDTTVRAWVPPGRGARTLARLVDAVFALRPSDRAFDLGRALRELSIRHRRRAMVVVLSEVADPLSVEEQKRDLARAGSRQRVVFAALDDPALREIDRGASGDDEETGADPALRAVALHLAEERRSSLKQLAGSGARVLDALPAEAAGALLAAWLDARRAAAL